MRAKLIREYIDIRRGIDVQKPLSSNDRRNMDYSNGYLVKKLLDTFHFLSYKSIEGFSGGNRKMKIILETGLNNYHKSKIIKELNKWFRDFTKYHIIIKTKRIHGINQFEITVFDK